MLTSLFLASLAMAAGGPTLATAACQSSERHTFQLLHADSCVPDADVTRQLRLLNAQLLTGIADQQSCAMACARLKSGCAVLQFHFVSRLCHVTSELPRPASEAEAAATASRGDCVATLLRRDASRATGFQLARRLSIFFDFRISDRNLGGSVDAPVSTVRSAQFLGAAVRNSSGAALPGRSDSFVKIGVEAPGFRALVPATKEYSFFFSIAGMPSLPHNDQMHLLRIVPSSEPDDLFCAFTFFIGSRLRFANLFTETVAYEADSFDTFASQQKFFVLMGYANSSAASTAVLNGSFVSVNPYKNDYMIDLDIVFDEIRLGVSERPLNSWALKGTIVCFAMAPFNLSAEELHALASFC